MANYAQVMWGGGILSSTTSGDIVYHSPLDSGATDPNQGPISGAPFIKSYLSGVTIDNGEVKPSGQTLGANITDADAYVMESGGTIHVFKSDCTSKMRCYYNPTGGATRLINDNRDIWYASISNGQFNISCNYDKYNEKDKNNNLRITDGRSGNTAFGFASNEEKNADFYFLNYDKNSGTYGTKMKNQTTQGMFAGCTNLTACEIPCKMRVISNGTFSGCTSLSSYTRNPDFVEEIGEYAFDTCTSMKTLLIPKYASVGKGSFANCTRATHIRWDKLSGIKYNTGNGNILSDEAFKNCTSLSGTMYTDGTTYDYVHIPSGYTAIGKDAFSGCTKIAKLKFNEGINTIGENAFAECTSLNGILNDGSYSTTGITSIGNRAFYNTRKLSGFTFNTTSSLSIGEYAFANSALSGSGGVSLTNTSAIVGQYAFYNCSASTMTVNIPTISGHMFSDCSKLSNLTLEYGVRKISGYGFSNCTSLGEVVIPDSTTDVIDGAFSNCSSLTSVTIGNKVSAITKWNEASGTFANTDNLKNVTFKCPTVKDWFAGKGSVKNVRLMNGVSTVEREALKGCTNLSSLTIDNGVTSLGNGAFQNCDLREVIIPTSVISGGSLTFANNNLLTAVTIGGGISSAVSNSDMFENCSAITTATIDCQEINAWFSGKTNLSTVNINNESPIFGENCFKNCTNLSNIVFNNDSKPYEIYESAFENCSGLTQFNGFAYPLRKIGDSAFCNTRLSDIVMVESYYPNKTTKMSYGDYCFANISGCNSVKIESGVSVSAHTFEGTRPAIVSANCDTIDTWFSGNTNLKELVIGDNTKTIGTSAFTDCTSLSSLTIGNSVTNIKSRAFYNCQSLTSITIPNSVTNIESRAFRYCKSATTLNLGQSISAISEGAFGDLDALKGELVIPDSVKTLGNGAFTQCASQSSGLTEITIGSGVTSIPGFCFTQIIFDSNSIGKITIPSTVTSIGTHAFFGCENVKAVYSYNDEPPTLVGGPFDDITGGKILYVPSAAISDYINSQWHNIFGNNIQPILDS